MNIRIDYQPPGSASGEPRPGGRRGLAVAVGVGLVVLIVALVIARPEHDDGHKASPTGTPTAAAGQGLARGQASATGRTGTRLVSGKPRGFPHSEVGAVEAATTYMAATYDIKRMPRGARVAYIKDVTGQSAELGDADAQAFRQKYNLNEQGQPVGPLTGQPVPGVKFLSSCHPELGAYKVEQPTAEQVLVQVWFPCVIGTVPDGAGDSPPNVEVSWTQGTAQMTWKARDWVATGGNPPSPLIIPANRNQVAVPYAQRAQLLGSGWRLYADASEAMPEDLKDLGDLQ